MKKKFPFFLTLLILFAFLLPQGGGKATDSSGIIHISVNDKLLPFSSYRPYYYSSQYYLPLAAFQEIGVTYTADITASTFILKYGGSSLTFDLSTGDSYNANGDSYGAKAIYVGAIVFLPAYSVSAYFGITASYISGTGNGDIIRIKTGNATYSDSELLVAAAPQLLKEASAYITSRTTPTPDWTQVPAQTPTPSASPTPVIDKSGAVITLVFVGAPTETVLDELHRHEMPALFLLGHDDVSENPGMLRRAAGLGCKFGAWLDGNTADFPEIASLIYDVTREKPLFASSSEEAPEESPGFTAESPYIQIGCDLDVSGAGVKFNAASWLLMVEGAAVIRFHMDDADSLPGFLSLLSTYKFSVKAIHETDTFS